MILERASWNFNYFGNEKLTVDENRYLVITFDDLTGTYLYFWNVWWHVENIYRSISHVPLNVADLERETANHVEWSPPQHNNNNNSKWISRRATPERKFHSRKSKTKQSLLLEPWPNLATKMKLNQSTNGQK